MPQPHADVRVLGGYLSGSGRLPESALPEAPVPRECPVSDGKQGLGIEDAR